MSSEHTNTKRSSNYDLLRIIAMVFVVYIHSQSAIHPFQQGFLTVVGIAVPVFLMISGAFILSNETTLSNLKGYYIKRFKSIVFPFLIFTVAYIISSACCSLYYQECSTFGEAINYEFNYIYLHGKTTTGGQLWFMYIIIPFYIVAPLIILFRKKCKIGYMILTPILLVLSVLNYHLGFVAFPWYLNFISYLPVIMFGDVLKNFVKAFKYDWIIYLILYLIVVSLQIYLKQSIVFGGNRNEFAITLFNEGSRTFGLRDPNTLEVMNITCGSLVFLIFKKIKINIDLSYLASLSYYIYLIHCFFNGFTEIVFNSILKISTETGIFIILAGTLNLIISFFLAIPVMFVFTKKMAENKHEKNSKILQLTFRVEAQIGNDAICDKPTHSDKTIVKYNK